MESKDEKTLLFRTATACQRPDTFSPIAEAFGGFIVNGRIVLTDLDRPEETLKVEIVALDEAVLSVSVPNTIVQFKLFRHKRSAVYVGSLGGRSFVFVPTEAEAIRKDKRRK